MILIVKLRQYALTAELGTHGSRHRGSVAPYWVLLEHAKQALSGSSEVHIDGSGLGSDMCRRISLTRQTLEDFD